MKMSEKIKRAVDEAYDEYVENRRDNIELAAENAAIFGNKLQDFTVEATEGRGFGIIFRGKLTQGEADELTSLLAEEDIYFPFEDDNGDPCAPKINPNVEYMIGVELSGSSWYGTKYSAYICRVENL